MHNEHKKKHVDVVCISYKHTRVPHFGIGMYPVVFDMLDMIEAFGSFSAVILSVVLATGEYI